MKLIYLIPIAIVIFFILVHFLRKATRFILRLTIFLGIAAILFMIFFA